MWVHAVHHVGPLPRREAIPGDVLPTKTFCQDSAAVSFRVCLQALNLLLGLPSAANCDTWHTTFAICHPCYFIPSLFYYSRLTRKITVLGSSVEELRRRLDTLSPPSKGQVGWAAQYEGDLHAPWQLCHYYLLKRWPYEKADRRLFLDQPSFPHYIWGIFPHFIDIDDAIPFELSIKQNLVAIFHVYVTFLNDYAMTMLQV